MSCTFSLGKLQSQMVLELEQITFEELAQEALSVSQLFQYGYFPKSSRPIKKGEIPPKDTPKNNRFPR